MPMNEVAEAIAVRGDKIVAVGSDKQVKAYQGSETETIDLAGKTVIPGIIGGPCPFDACGQ